MRIETPESFMFGGMEEQRISRELDLVETRIAAIETRLEELEKLLQQEHSRARLNKLRKEQADCEKRLARERKKEKYLNKLLWGE